MKMLLEVSSIHNQNIKDFTRNLPAVKHHSGIARSGRIVAERRVESRRIDTALGQGLGHLGQGHIPNHHLIQRQPGALQSPADDIGAQGGKGHADGLARQRFNRAHIPTGRKDIAPPGLIQNQHHVWTPVRSPCTDIHQFDSRELGYRHVTAQIGMHNLLGIGKLNCGELQIVPFRQTLLLSQKKILITRPAGDRHAHL